MGNDPETNHLNRVIGYMKDVEKCRWELAVLGQQWDFLTILGQMSGGYADTTATREGFKSLTEHLLTNLGLANLKKISQQITSKAQVAVDIVVRNLFERTADIGFLATDDDVRDFLRLRGDSKALIARFKEYVAKYSVYHNIILLDRSGNVLAQILEPKGDLQSKDPLIQEAIHTSATYVEVFRHSDLEPELAKSLIYAYRVTETNYPSSNVLGVLCLCFRFENEMTGIFANLVDKDDWSVVTLLDRSGTVISSSDAHHIPIGARLEMATECKVVKFAGRLYLAKTNPTKGYQGYTGPGWFGHAMIPLEHAFNVEESAASDGFDQEMLEAVIQDSHLFPDELRQISKDAGSIQRELDRTVWNGNVQQDVKASNSAANKILLWEVSRTGALTKSVFERAIKNLRETVVSSVLNDMQFLASLAIDIMDRNLYERANDCRWWALTSAFRTLLSQPTLSPAERKQIGATLTYINGLYTVYSLLLVYDRSGMVVAVSNVDHEHLVGQILDSVWVKETLSLADSQSYSVSAFEASKNYGGKHTYIYGAPITDPRNSRHVVGGIGIIFDSTPQFAAMLHDALPRHTDGMIEAGCFSLFTDRSGTIISTTDNDLAVGGRLALEGDFFRLRNGHGISKIVPFRGHHCAIGAHVSSGYREFKGEGDSYKNDVIALVGIPLGELSEKKLASPHAKLRRNDIPKMSRRSGGGGLEIATFYIDGLWFGVVAENVVEAIAVERITQLPGAVSPVTGVSNVTLFRGGVLPVLNFHFALGAKAHVHDENSQIVVLKTNCGLCGLLVDSLGEIPEVTQERIDRTTTFGMGERGITGILGIVKPEGNDFTSPLLILLDPLQLHEMRFNKNEESEKRKARPIAVTLGNERVLNTMVAPLDAYKR